MSHNLDLDEDLDNTLLGPDVSQQVHTEKKERRKKSNRLSRR